MRLGSTKQVVDSSQAIENSYSYEAFGQPTIGQSDVANPYLFVGGYGVQWESTPSLYYMQARYYSPGVGRFLSEDPLGGSPQDPLSLHRYLYCANGPVSSVDAPGTLPTPVWIAIIVLAVWVVYYAVQCFRYWHRWFSSATEKVPKARTELQEKASDTERNEFKALITTGRQR